MFIGVKIDIFSNLLFSLLFFQNIVNQLFGNKIYLKTKSKNYTFEIARRGVAGSNPVIPTTHNQRVMEIFHNSFFIWCKLWCKYF